MRVTVRATGQRAGAVWIERIFGGASRSRTDRIGSIASPVCLRLAVDPRGGWFSEELGSGPRLRGQSATPPSHCPCWTGPPGLSGSADS
jgi:hypothetical protein